MQRNCMPSNAITDRKFCIHVKTTGLDAYQGHKICEIAVVEFDQNYQIVREYHRYLNPQRAMSTKAKQINGYDETQLLQCPTFNQVVQEFLGFIRNGVIYSHYMPFDKSFISSELSTCGYYGLDAYVKKTVSIRTITREIGRYGNNTFMGLCSHYGIAPTSTRINALEHCRILLAMLPKIDADYQTLMQRKERERDARLGAEKRVATSREIEQPSQLPRVPQNRNQAQPHSQSEGQCAKSANSPVSLFDCIVDLILDNFWTCLIALMILLMLVAS